MPPEVTVAIPSHGRAERLVRLLEALEGQTCARDRYEVVVCHDYAPGHLPSNGGIREVVISHGSGGPALQRNRAWRAGAAPLVAFIDDDCRPAPDWLESLLRAADANPGAIVEGRTAPDPEEVHLLQRAHSRTQEIDPPSVHAQTCNILYPRPLLERVGGFDEQAFPMAGEDTDLMLRSLAAGARHAGAPEALVWHAVDPGSLRGRLRTLPRWQNIVLLTRRHRSVRSTLPLRLFWKPSHVRVVPALAGIGLAAATRRPHWLWLVLPWFRIRGCRYGTTPRAIAASTRDTGGRLLIDTTELVMMLRGSWRYRTLML